LIVPGGAVFDTPLENSFMVPKLALTEVSASLDARPEPTRGFVAAEELPELVWLPQWDETCGRLAIRLARGPVLLARRSGAERGELE
jgi:hypothetical protein